MNVSYQLLRLSIWSESFQPVFFPAPPPPYWMALSCLYVTRKLVWARQYALHRSSLGSEFNLFHRLQSSDGSPHRVHRVLALSAFWYFSHKYFPAGYPKKWEVGDLSVLLVHCSRECTLPYLSTGIWNLLQPAQAEVLLGQLSTYLASLGSHQPCSFTRGYRSDFTVRCVSI